MPFKSKKQVKWMMSEKPEMAAQWLKDTPDVTHLPLKAKKTTNAVEKYHATRGK